MRIARAALSGLLAMAALALLVGGVLLATGQLPYRIYAVQSGSMSPGIPTKSAVLVDGDRDHAVGDVIAFELADKVTTHRLIAIEADGMYVTKGDAVDQVDPFPITEADVIGPVVGSVSELGYWLVYLQQPVGIASIVCAAIGIWLIWSVATELGRDDEVEQASDSEHELVDGELLPALG